MDHIARITTTNTKIFKPFFPMSESVRVLLSDNFSLQQSTMKDDK